MIQEDHAIAPPEPLSREVLETELVLASQMRSLVHVHRVLVHDLKAPLNAMQLALDLLADSLADNDPPGVAAERRQRHLAILREEIARLDRILRTMVEQKEPGASAPGSFDLREIIQEIGIVLLPQARRQRVELRLELPDNVVTVTGYRDRLKQALLNLALQGLEAMPDGGCLRIGAVARGETVVITVEDGGSGSRRSASGIGLYVARLVVESHGGEMAEEGNPGVGAQFRVTLPRG